MERDRQNNNTEKKLGGQEDGIMENRSDRNVINFIKMYKSTYLYGLIFKNKILEERAKVAAMNIFKR